MAASSSSTSSSSGSDSTLSSSRRRLGRHLRRHHRIHIDHHHSDGSRRDSSSHGEHEESNHSKRHKKNDRPKKLSLMEFSGTIPSSRSESNVDAMHLDGSVPSTGARKNDDGDDSSNGPSVGLVKYNEKKIRLAVAKMIIVDELPFRFVEKQGFKDFMTVVEPRFPIPSRITVMQDCLKIYFSEKDKLRDIFMASSYKICMTTDMWTSV